MIQKKLLEITIILILCWLCYQYGKSKAKTEIIEKQIEVIRYETKEICHIMAKPNLDDDNIVRLFNENKL